MDTPPRFHFDTPTIADARARRKDIAALNGFLRAEIAAVDTYRQCRESLEDPAARDCLESLQTSHQDRRDKLHNRIELLGGTPDQHSGVWGAVVGLVEGGAVLISTRAALDVLQREEDLALRRYEGATDVSSATRTFIAKHLLPQQRRSTQTLHDLRNSL